MFIKKIPNIKTLMPSKNKKIINEFNEFKKNIIIDINPISKPRIFYKNMKKLLDIYIYNFKLMDELYESLTKTKKAMWKEKAKIINNFIKKHFLINAIVFNLGSYEKKIWTKKLKKSPINGIAYIGSLRAKYFHETPIEDEKIRKIIKREIPFLNENDWALKNLIKKFKTNKIIEKEIKREYDYYEKIAILDDFYEFLLRESGYFLLDVNFIEKLSKLLKTDISIKEVIKKLDKKINSSYRLPIPEYTQKTTSCGVICLLNAMNGFGYFYKKSLEEEWFEKIKKGNFPNNLPTSLILIALEEGFPAFLLIDFDKYMENIKKTEYKNSKILEIFLEEMNEIYWINIKNIKKEKIIEILDCGGVIAPVIDISNKQLHYNLIFGYSKKGILVFDPLFKGHKIIEYKKINKWIRNYISFWAIVIYSKEKYLLDRIKKQNIKMEKYIKRLENEMVLLSKKDIL